MTATERGMQMMEIPMGQLPKRAQNFAKWKCSRVGMCMEVLLFCWCVYANIAEGLVADNPEYAADDEDIEWFTANA